MHISKIKIKNFKCFKNYEMTFNKKLNILVGMNDVGKTTILEAINLCLSGQFRGKYLKNNIVQDIFNNLCVQEYIEKINIDHNFPLPECIIELYIEDSDPIQLGKENSDNENVACITYKIEFDSKYSEEYELYKSTGNIFSLPIEYYTVSWHNSAGVDITGKSVPLKSIIIDATESTIKSGNDIKISKIIKDNLEDSDIIGISQLYRDVRDSFTSNELMTAVNKKLSENTHILNTSVQIDVESLNSTEWEKSVITKINSVPFEYVGKGIQSAVKIELALSSKKAESSLVVLIEEPENHLSYPKMNKLINEIINSNNEKQIFITTHSSFVANKLKIENLILLNDSKFTRFNNLSDETKNFFMKKPGYDTLRFLLCKKAILVEGDADELILQRAYLDKYNVLPIENEVDVISVGTAFLRFLELGDLVEKNIVVVTDNDGNIDALISKYKNYLGVNKKPYIKISYDEKMHIDYGNLKADNDGKFNYDTLEPCLVRANNLNLLNEIFKTNKDTEDSLIYYMVHNKTKCALEIFDSPIKINYPKYIRDAIDE